MSQDPEKKIAIAPNEPEQGSEIPEEAAPPTAEPQTDWQDKYLRAVAEGANLQRRLTAEKRDAIRYANSDIAKALIEVIDDLERTLEAAGDSEDVQSVVAGVRLIYDKLLKALSDHHVEPIEAEGHPFDPNKHEALMQQPAAGCAANTVLQEIQKGYTLHSRVLRPARVVVSAPCDDDAATPANGSDAEPAQEGA